EGNPLSALADEMGLVRIETDLSYVTRVPGGDVLSDADWPDWLEDVIETQHGAGADLDQINTSAYWLQSDYGGAEVVFPGGYAPLLEALTGSYDLRLNAEVAAITGDGPVRVALTDGTVEIFDAALVTLPLGVLQAKRVAFDPPLPAPKQDAIQRFGMGTLDKVYLRFEDVFWDDVTWIITPDTGQPPGHFNQWFNIHRFTGAPILLAFNGGTPALTLASVPDDDLIARASAVLERIYPS
ncbi:MAG: FAD-dependent oxidoreductase, partial [Pseudomonadota bacterium]